jgi:putative glycosyltransferase (TIGR04348 family)
VRIQVVSPGYPASLSGNSITARRYARLLSQLGHGVSIRESYTGAECDLLIALHARRSYKSIRQFHELKPALPLVVVLTGTDLYRDLRIHPGAQKALGMATRIVVLQEMGLRELPSHFREKTSIIYQSAEKTSGNLPSPSTYFRVCVIANLRREKDPFRIAHAIRRLPGSSRIRVIHVGQALDIQMQRRAMRENAGNERYRWVGAQPHWKTRRILASSHLLAITSRIEGSCNALCEALASSVPVVASEISGLAGTLGKNYPGYFPPGDTERLAKVLTRAESDPYYYAELKTRCQKLSIIVSPDRERNSWKEIISCVG